MNTMPKFSDIRRRAFNESLDAHQIKGKGLVHISLPVVLLSSDNPYLTAGERGILTIIEQGTSLNVIIAVFRAIDGTTHKLGAPVECRNPVFVYSPIDHRTAQDKMEEGQ